MMRLTALFLFIAFLIACQNTGSKSGMQVIGFVDALEDVTLAEARKGFFNALRDSGFVKDSSIKIIYRNAQNDMGVLSQSIDYLVSQQVQVIATNATISTIAAVQRNPHIPVCMMVSPEPSLAGLTDEAGNPPENLFGSYETLDYIDTALALIPHLLPKARRVGTIINQSEPQSVDALNRISEEGAKMGLQIVSLPVINSSETQLVTESLLSQGIDVFFALPDNVIFSSFETIVAACNRAGVPVITSESGLVGRGALAAFGADMYQWGYESGQSCATFLKTGKLPGPQKLKQRRRVYNPEQAKRYNIVPDSAFKPI
jgi:putative ABC transport system substrate-binding protein